MANLTSILIGGAAVSLISGLGFALGQNRNLYFDMNNVKRFCSEYDDNFKPNKIYISKEKKCAIIFDDGGQILILKSMGETYSARKILSENIYQAGAFISFKFNDFSFPDFSAEFKEKIEDL